MNMREYTFYIDPREISFLRFILEGYDGLAVLRTIDKESGLVSITVASGEEELFKELIESMRDKLNMVATSVKP